MISRRHRDELLSLLQNRSFDRTLVCGLASGISPVVLPGAIVVAADDSEEALRWHSNRFQSISQTREVSFLRASILDESICLTGCFDLVILWGVLYPWLIASASALVRQNLSFLTQAGSVVVTCHLEGSGIPGLPFSTLDQIHYECGDYTYDLSTAIR
jgi:hypothetical protein